MANIKLGDKVYEGVTSVKLNTTDGESVVFEDAPLLQEKSVTENGEVVPDAGYDGLSKVTVNVPESGGSGGVEDALSQWDIEDVFNDEKGGTDAIGDFSFVNANPNYATTYFTNDMHYACRLKKGAKGNLAFPNPSMIFSLDLTNLTQEVLEKNFYAYLVKYGSGTKTLYRSLNFQNVPRIILPEVFSHSFKIMVYAPKALFLPKYSIDTVVAYWIESAIDTRKLKCPTGANMPYYLNKFTYVPAEDFVEIFENLADISGEAEAKTITLGTTILDKLTEEQKDIARAKGWNLA